MWFCRQCTLNDLCKMKLLDEEFEAHFNYESKYARRELVSEQRTDGLHYKPIAKYYNGSDGAGTLEKSIVLV